MINNDRYAVQCNIIFICIWKPQVNLASTTSKYSKTKWRWTHFITIFRFGHQHGANILILNGDIYLQLYKRYYWKKKINYIKSWVKSESPLKNDFGSLLHNGPIDSFQSPVLWPHFGVVVLGTAFRFLTRITNTFYNKQIHWKRQLIMNITLNSLYS